MLIVACSWILHTVAFLFKPKHASATCYQWTCFPVDRCFWSPHNFPSLLLPLFQLVWQVWRCIFSTTQSGLWGKKFRFICLHLSTRISKSSQRRNFIGIRCCWSRRGDVCVTLLADYTLCALLWLVKHTAYLCAHPASRLLSWRGQVFSNSAVQCAFFETTAALLM